MNKSSLFLFSTTLAIVFSNLLIAGEIYTEPPILHKEIELQKQSEAKKAREQAAQAEKEKRIAKENAEQEKRLAKARAEQEKRLAAERERLAKEAEAKRLAAIEKNSEETTRKAEEKQLDEIKSAVAEKTRQERLAGGQTSSSDIVTARNLLNNLPPACSSSHMYTTTDGTVNVRVICIGSISNDSQSMTGLISIKNGVLTHVE